ncbi:GNAT family N-acetyltransferase [Kitasatospora sp. NPDC086801]|uniref:GNAT family N-acetyltransferase n=1 Tax=Kitasatospora sp. NPDC086801 TaxID=3364066 RepID=UPI0038288F5A
MATNPLVPADFTVPRELLAPEFRLEPLGEQHDDSDLAAWSGACAARPEQHRPHPRHPPGFVGRNRPPVAGTTAEQNLADLRRPAADFANRAGFAYTVLDPAGGEVIGGVHLYPDREDPSVAAVSSWVRADRAELDAPLHRAVSAWLAERWPLGEVRYASR